MSYFVRRIDLPHGQIDSLSENGDSVTDRGSFRIVLHQQSVFIEERWVKYNDIIDFDYPSGRINSDFFISTGGFPGLAWVAPRTHYCDWEKSFPVSGFPYTHIFVQVKHYPLSLAFELEIKVGRG